MKHKLLMAMVVVSIIGVAGVAAVLAQGPKPHAPAVPSAAGGTGFTYQGQLKKNGLPVNTFCSMTFSLWDAASAGNQSGVGQLVDLVTVTNGIFTVLLNGGNQFGGAAFSGDARWLQPEVQCGADVVSTVLSRQPLLASPYALGLVPGAVISGTVYPALTVRTTFGSGNGLEAYAESGPNGWAVLGQGSGIGVLGLSQDGAGVHGESGGAGTGVSAVGNNNGSAPNTALTLSGGAFRVISTTVSPAFVWTPVVIYGNCSQINNPLTDGRPDAILLVTPHQVTIIVPATDIRVLFDSRQWNICSPSLAADMYYNILVINR
jgi:hypothetical protein